MFAAVLVIGVIVFSARATIIDQQELSHESFFSVRKAIREAPKSVIVFGDSIVEGASLPEKVAGTYLVNAGVIGAGISYFQHYSVELLGSSQPKLIVLAVRVSTSQYRFRKSL